MLTLLTASLLTAPACRGRENPSSGIDLAGMDKSVRPGDDLEYVNGGWLKATPIPPDKAAVVHHVNEVRKRTRTLIEEASASTSTRTRMSREDRSILRL